MSGNEDRLVTEIRNALATFLLTVHVTGAIAGEALNCESPVTAPDPAGCAAARRVTADQEMNAALRKLVDALRKRGEPETAIRLEKAQLDWTRFQRSHCDVESTYEGAGGSFVSAKWGACMAETAIERTKYLQTLLSHFN